MTDVWLVKAPDGTLYASSISALRGRAIDLFIEQYGGNWYALEAQGYTVKQTKLCDADSVVLTPEQAAVYLSHNDACDLFLSDSAEPVCDCGFDDFVEAIEKDKG